MFYVNYVSIKLGKKFLKISLQPFLLPPLSSYDAVAMLNYFWSHKAPMLSLQACVHAVEYLCLEYFIRTCLPLSLPAGFHLSFGPLSADITAWRKSLLPPRMRHVSLLYAFKLQFHSSYSNTLRFLSCLSPSLAHQLLENTHCLGNSCLFCTSTEP